ncbi:MAG: histidine phosphatase family protein [Acidimicrobiales bacterium]|nr:histidine phosphatase family protein [Acidimicrobiales bacterium]
MAEAAEPDLTSPPEGRGPTRLVLVRHGEAHAGFHGVIGGRTGCAGLTPHGRTQAEALRRRLETTRELRADVLLASVLPRAIETADIIAPGMGLPVAAHECDLCEIHTGDADGLEWTEYTTRFGTFDMEAEPDRVFAPEGESWNSFHARVRQMLERIATEYIGQTVVAVCHAGVIGASVRVLFDIPHPGSGATLQPTNTGLTEWRHDPSRGRWTLHRFNDATHLIEQAASTSAGVGRSAT